jgi:hypothetical protein
LWRCIALAISLLVIHDKYEQIVLVITTSKHRKNAFDACEFMMDYLKIQAPFWKKEVSKDGSKWGYIYLFCFKIKGITIHSGIVKTRDKNISIQINS